MYKFDVNLTPQPMIDMPIDPRGGPIPSVSSSSNYNNLHIPYRGGDFAAPHVDPATGVPLSYLQTMPGLDVMQNSVALNQVLKSIVARQRDNPGGNNQRYYGGMSFGVTIDGN